MKVIDLDDHRDSDAPVLSGRPRGKAVRESTCLDVIDDQEDNIVIRIPQDVYLVASSFFLGMLGPSIRKLGEEEFRKRFSFEGTVNKAVLNDVIREARRRESPLSAA
ncbi:MAG: hypothetical protein PPP56_01640 [Longimonas sp.]|uniref:hypothetical protein n=1 Tax=Longimonas sp. TaxID=2039626 RepID=UPI00334D882F